MKGAPARHLIWVIDDDRDVRGALKDYLEIEDFDVRTFDDGAAAWSAIEAGDPRPSAIVLDQEMPRMDGREFRKRQIARPDVANIPVLVFTASGPVVVPGALVMSKVTPIDAVVATLRVACADADGRRLMALDQAIAEKPRAREPTSRSAAQRKKKRRSARQQ